jgi:Bax protein
LVLLVNEHITKERQQLLQIESAWKAGKVLSESQYQFLQKLGDEYDVASLDIVELKKRVDIVPTSLALAQAAEESGWGTSRFAQGGNALYGQQVHTADEGMLPINREDGRTHYVKGFDSLFDTVLAYTRNLNTHRAYSEFREVRAGERRMGKSPDSFALVKTLNRYSERKDDYVRTIETIMRLNDLGAFDNAKLRLSGSEV